MNRHVTLIAIIFLIICNCSSAQTLPVGTALLEDVLRKDQNSDTNYQNNSFTVRPLFLSNKLSNDSANLFAKSILNSKERAKFLFANNKGQLKLLPINIKQQINSHHPYGWNDGSAIPSKGYQFKLSAGLYTQVGPLSVQLQPEMVYAQNNSFTTFPSSHSDSTWKSYYYVLNRIDNPERYGMGNFYKIFPGQSSIRINHKKLSIGISSENLWWGPGYRNALIMSNNAPGFKHITFNTTTPINSTIGSFEGQVISGLLEQSGVLPDNTSKTFEGQPLYIPKKVDDRYINGMVLTWQPRWTKGLYLGFSRAFYQYRSNVSSSVNGYLPIATAFFKNKAQDENTFGRDQLFSLFFRLVLPESKAEIYAEYGRNDHSQNTRDLILEPEHASAYILGFRKLFAAANNNKQVEGYFELAHLQNPPTHGVRALEGWYTHYQVRDGYTHQGQVLGAGIGPGGNSQTLGVNFWKGINKMGVFVERVVHNNDFYYDAFSPQQIFTRHWIDLSFNLNKSWQQNRFIYAANLSFIRSFNYQWRYEPNAGGNVDVNNVHTNISVSYLF